MAHSRITRAAKLSLLTMAKVPATVAGAETPLEAMDMAATGIPALASSIMASDDLFSNTSGATGQFIEENIGFLLSFSSSPTTADANLICHSASSALSA